MSRIPLVLWDFTGTNGNEGDGGGRGRGSYTHKKDSLGWTIIICYVKAGYCKFMGGGGYICFRGVGG